MSTPQWFFTVKDYFFSFSNGTSMWVIGVKSSRHSFCVSSFLYWDLPVGSSASGWQTEEGERLRLSYGRFSMDQGWERPVSLLPAFYWLVLSYMATELQGGLGNGASLCLAEAGKGVVGIWSASLQAGNASLGPEPAKVLHMRSIMNKYCWMNEWINVPQPI